MLIVGNIWQEIDLRIGASFTRFQTMLLRDAFVLDFAGDERNLVLSYGPCQVCCFLQLTTADLFSIIECFLRTESTFFFCSVSNSWLYCGTLLGDTVPRARGVLDNKLFTYF